MITQRVEKKALTLRGQHTRGILLQAAEEVFARRGLQHASVQQIAQRAGVATGTIYVHFDGKEALFLALVGELGQRVEAHVLSRTADARDGKGKQRAVLEAFLDFVLKHPHLYRLVRQSEELDPNVYREFYRRLADAWRQALTERMQQGEVATVDPEVMAWVLMGVLHFVGMRCIEWATATGSVPDGLLDDVSAFVEAGLKAPRPLARIAAAPPATPPRPLAAGDDGYSFYR